jgi:urease accessory protein
MRRATRAMAKGAWEAGRQVATVTLGFDDRYRRRLRMTDDAGEPFLLDLERATVLAEGSGLLLTDGGIIAVHAAEEAVLDVACEDQALAARLAWHVGNRHTPLQVLADGTLRLRDDPVRASMLQGMGADVVRRQAPFDPEAGAYAASRHDREQARDAHDHAH